MKETLNALLVSQKDISGHLGRQLSPLLPEMDIEGGG